MFGASRQTRFRQAAVLLTVMHACVMLSAQNSAAGRGTTQDSKFKIVGTVVSSLSGAALGNVRVSIANTKNRANVRSVITAEDGRFEFGQLQEGKFSLEGAKRGYIPGAYEQHEQFSTAIVTGAGFDTENLVLRLTPLAVLSGKVFDEWGDPVRGANLTLYHENHSGGMTRILRAANAATDDRGSYEFAFLTPGTYFVSVEGKPWYAMHPVSSSTVSPGMFPQSVARFLDVAYPTTYYNGATDAAGATPIAIKGGDRLQIDLRLSPVPALHILFRSPSGDQQSFNAPTFQKRVFDSMEYVGSEVAQAVSPGVYELTGVPAGKYTVRMRDSKTGKLDQSSEIELNKDGQELDIGRGEPASSVKLSVKMQREETRPKELSVALQDSRRQIVAIKAADAGGEVTFEDLPAGKYAMLVSAAGKPYSIVRTSVQGVETSGHNLTVGPGASVEATVFVAGGVVNVDGFAKRGGKLAAGVMIALVPNDPQSHLELFRRDQSDFDGSFVLPAVIPGSYTIIAVEDAWGFDWLKPGVLARYVEHGQNLTIGTLMERTVHLPDPVEVQPR